MLQGWMPKSLVFRKKSKGEGGCIVLAMALGVADPWATGLEVMLTRVLLHGV